MNDSPYGLTASIWTNAAANPKSEEAFEHLAAELETGTVFLNRCDYLDPALAWTGVKNSGRGISLSKYGTLCNRRSCIAFLITSATGRLRSTDSCQVGAHED